jgi:glycosyltransferase involved in cell wall biosynthesis
MTSYNHKEYIGLAIESILNQTFSNFEFIIVDDNSTDGSQEVIKKYEDIDNRINR